MIEFQKYKESADYLKKLLNGFEPEVMLILGSGLGFLGDLVEYSTHVPYDSIPHFKKSTAPGHAGKFVFGTLSGKKVAVMQGRLHLYEGYTPYDVAYPVRVLKLLGVDKLIVTNASGGVNTSYKVGDLVLIEDFIKFSDTNPLTGANLPEFGTRFCDMSYTFSKKYRNTAKEVGKELGIDLKEGVYFYMSGPQYETPAEIRAIRVLGGDVVGMSTVPECISANQCGMEILGISLVTNMAAGVLDVKLSEQEVLDEGKKASGYFSKLILEFLRRI